MLLEYSTLITSWIVTIISLCLLIPKNKIRIAHVSFLFQQVMTWMIGLSIVQLKLIEYPVRFFAYANRTSFTFEYFVYPAMCATPNKKVYGSKFCAMSYTAQLLPSQK